ncbi:MAG: hypothetical protein OZSIB_3731 [Candidatus Ozemobacter sibiricus]|jgi:hypothetical protein|uniref:Preprotein translocase subunit SecB n=1 Tax=Candidatus Ozemobacter sibiricus TaxID=2268124 RepID=A0A367ZCD9_9BACT|nr:MAG: hypothetical protein OZSIB_3731 [Candidatus Ozemobacter sibiricus]
MSLSPLQLHRYFIEEFFCKANPDFKDGSKIGMNAFQVFFETGEEVDPRLRRIRLTVSQDITKGGNEPFAFKVVLVGFFEVVKEFFENQGLEATNKLINVNGPALLYSAARELLALLSGRGPDPNRTVDVLLPSITFLDFQPMPKTATGREVVGPRKLPRTKKK